MTENLLSLAIRPVRLARMAVVLIFALNGMVFANWAARIPEMQQRLALSEGQLGLTLLGMSVGLLSFMPFNGALIDRWGSRAVTAGGAAVYCATLPLLALAPTPVMLWLGLFVFGASTGAMDIGMNAQAVFIERQVGRSIMSSFHAAYSVGGFIGAALSGLIIGVGFGIHTHFLLAAGVSLALVVAVAAWLLDDPPGANESGGPVFRLPGKTLLPLGIIALCAAVGEGAMADWTAVYLRGTVATSASVATLGFAAFSITMTGGRLLGDRLIERFGAASLIRASGLIAALGLSLAVLVPLAPTAIGGFALVGVGLSVVIPIVFSRAGNMPDVPSGTGIASVATLGYSGFLAGPPLIGLLAEVASLQAALGVVALLIAVLIYLARYVRTPAALDESP